MIKELTKKIMRSAGIEVFQATNLPFGMNEFSDITRTVNGFDPHVIFDVGANIGQESIRYRSIFKAKIYAFEPVPSTYKTLVQNVAGFDIKTFPIGFGSEKRKVKIFLQESSGLNSMTESLNNPTGIGCEEAEVTTMDAFCEDNKIEEISFLKIDTEGFGLQVLDGAKKMLAGGKISWIFIEVGFSDDDKRHDRFCDVSKILGQYSFTLFGFYNQWIKNSKLEYCNALFKLGKV